MRRINLFDTFRINKIKNKYDASSDITLNVWLVHIKQDLCIFIVNEFPIRVSRYIVNDKYLLFQKTNDVLGYFFIALVNKTKI